MPSYVSASKNSLCLFRCSLAFLLSPMSRVGRACVVAPELLCLGKKRKRLCNGTLSFKLSSGIDRSIFDLYIWYLFGSDEEAVALLCGPGIPVYKGQCLFLTAVMFWPAWGKTYWKRALFPIIAAMLDAKHSSHLKESKSLFWSQVWVTMAPEHRLSYSKYCALKWWPFGEVYIVTEPWIEVLFKCIGRNIR